MQRNRIDPVNYSKVMDSQMQTATQGNRRVGRELGNPNQTVTRSEDMDPWIGPEGKQDLRRTLYIKILFANSEHLPVYYIRRDINNFFILCRVRVIVIVFFRAAALYPRDEWRDVVA